MGATAAASQGIQSVSSVGNGYIQAGALRNQAGLETGIASLNNQKLAYEAGMADLSAADTLRRGNTVANNRAGQGIMQAGKIRAEAAASGGNGGSGSDAASNALEQVGDVSATDQAAIKTNAYRAAFGLQSSAIAMRGEEDANTIQARMKANQLDYMAKSSMITGWSRGLGFGMSAAGNFSKSRKNSLDDQEG